MSVKILQRPKDREDQTERQDQMQELRGLFLRPAEFEPEVVRCALGYGGVAEGDLV